MLNDAKGFDRIYIATGYTDMRKGIEGLASIVQYQFDLNPHDTGAIFLFCGRRPDRIKALVWEGDGFLLMYKRLECGGSFRWPRSADEILSISRSQYKQLMHGFDIIARKPVRKMDSAPAYV